MKVQPLAYGDRKVYSVAAFNRGVGDWLARLPTIWVEGEVTELRRHEGWQSVFFTLKDPVEGACLPATMGRGRFDALRLDLHRDRWYAARAPREPAVERLRAGLETTSIRSTGRLRRKHGQSQRVLTTAPQAVP